MYRNSSDKRVQRTGHLLFEALFRLLKIKPFSDISITEISSAAGIGRATFYRNFDYVKDILKLKVDQLFMELNTLSMKYKFNDSDSLKVFFQFWVKHPKVLWVLVKSDYWSIFINALNQAYTTTNITELTAHTTLTPMQTLYLQNIISSKLSSLLQTWVIHDQQETAGELFELFELPYRLAIHHEFIDF